MGNSKGRRALLLLLAALFMLPAGGCGGEAPPDHSQDPASSSASQQPTQERVRLSISLAAPESSATVQTLRSCAQTLREEDRELDIFRIYSEGRMGSDALLLEGAIQGTLSIVKMDMAQLEQVVPETALLAIPLTFQSPQEYNQVLDGPFGDWLQERFAQAGLRLLDASATSWKYLTTDVPLRTPEDLKKVHIRLLDSSVALNTWRNAGARAGTLEPDELYMALQDGTFNTQENPIQMVVGTSLDEVQDYLIDARQQLATYAFVMNLEQYDQLPQGVQEDLEDYLRAFYETYSPLEEERVRENMEELKKRGTMQFLELDPAIQDTLAAAREPVLTHLRQELGDEGVDLFLTSLAQVRHG